MHTVYLDNGATSFPKAPQVAQNMSDYVLHVGSSVNRGAYDRSFEAENRVFETREMLCELFAFDRPENMVFTKNITESMNVLLKGLLVEGDHVIVSSMEHNAVMRPLQGLAPEVSFSRLPCNQQGDLCLNKLEECLTEKTRLVVMTHASNVCGTILDLEKVGDFCQKHQLFFIIDSAQTAGFCPIDFDRLHADAIAFTGHKSLLGPQGIGGFLISQELAHLVRPLIEGGTGSSSEKEIQPDYMPDKFEAGTPNIPGIYGLHAALCYLRKVSIESIRQKEMQLVEAFLRELESIRNIRLIGKKTTESRTGIVSVDFCGLDNAEVSHSLAKTYKILTRSGLHCAPSAHKTLGTFPQGTVRFSLSHFTTPKDIDYTLSAIRELIGS